VAGELQYTLPDTILDVFEPAMFIPSENPDTKHTTGELVCMPMDMATWQTLTNKGSISSRPQLYVTLRSGAAVQLKFWPVPSEAGTMRLKTTRLFGSSIDGTKNPDLQRYWYDALVWCLAYYLAIDASMPADKIQMLQVLAEDKKRACVNYSFEHTAIQATVEAQTQWSA
jgi:hypothetical protein